jgi:DNA primase
MIPIKDVEGVLYGYLGRDTTYGQSQNLAESSKYLFPPGLPKSKLLFGAYELRQHLADSGLPLSSRYKEIYLVESPFCVMKFASLGLPAVSCFGWCCSPEQLQILTALCKGVVYLPDRNKRAEAGQHLHSLSERLWLRFPPLPEHISDPEQLQSVEEIQSLTR